MKLTPLDIRHQEFGGALSGYSRKAVRAFLGDLADQFEELLRENLTQGERILDLERRVEAYRAGEEELKRTLVSAERLTTEMKASAQKEAELVLRDAHVERDRVLGELQARVIELEARHGARVVELESDHRARATNLESQFAARSSDLEGTFSARAAELEQRYAVRAAELEQNFSARAAAIEHETLVRRTKLENDLTRLKAERAQFLAQYRSLLAGFAELARHHEADLDIERDLNLLPSDVPTLEEERDEDRMAFPEFSHTL